MNYTLPRPTFDMFAEVLGKDRAENFASAFEQMVATQRAELAQQLLLDQVQLKAVVKNELRNELVTREIFEERFGAVDKRFEQMDKRFEQMDKRFEQLVSRIDNLMIWSFATTLTVGGLVVAAIKLL